MFLKSPVAAVYLSGIQKCCLHPDENEPFEQLENSWKSKWRRVLQEKKCADYIQRPLMAAFAAAQQRSTRCTRSIWSLPQTALERDFDWKRAFIQFTYNQTPSDWRTGESMPNGMTEFVRSYFEEVIGIPFAKLFAFKSKKRASHLQASHNRAYQIVPKKAIAAMLTLWQTSGKRFSGNMKTSRLPNRNGWSKLVWITILAWLW